MKIARCYYSLHDWEQEVSISADEDFTFEVVARNVDTIIGHLTVMTPPSQFRTPASSGPEDGLAVEVAPTSSRMIGRFGGVAGEQIKLTASTRITVFITVETADNGVISVSST